MCIITSTEPKQQFQCPLKIGKDLQEGEVIQAWVNANGKIENVQKYRDKQAYRAF